MVRRRRQRGAGPQVQALMQEARRRVVLNGTRPQGGSKAAGPQMGCKSRAETTAPLSIACVFILIRSFFRVGTFPRGLYKDYRHIEAPS